LSKGEFITVHDSDDWSNFDRFKKQMLWLEADVNNLMCGTGFLSYDKNLKVIEEFIPLTNYNELAENIKISGQFHGPTMMFRKNSTTEDYLYREYFQDNYEDTDLAYRLFQKGICTNIKDFLYSYRILSSSLCRKKFTVRNTQLYKVVVYLAEQRELLGYDSLMVKDISDVNDFYHKISQRYIEDKSLIYREGASYYMYWKYHAKAIKYSLRAVMISPFKIENIKTLIYCIRKGFLLHVFSN